MGLKTVVDVQLSSGSAGSPSCKTMFLSDLSDLPVRVPMSNTPRVSISVLTEGSTSVLTGNQKGEGLHLYYGIPGLGGGI